MYKFVKVKLKGIDKPYSNWYLYCDNEQTLIDHFTTQFKSEIQKGFSNYTDFLKGKAHINSPFGWAAHVTAQLKETSFLEGALTLEQKTLLDRLNYIRNGKKLLLAEGVSYMPFEQFDIIEEVEKPSITYINPNYTEADIKIIKWPGGTHYYAKIGKIDVVNEFGDQKWNTESTAMYYAKKFFNKLIRE